MYALYVYFEEGDLFIFFFFKIAPYTFYEAC